MQTQETTTGRVALVRCASYDEKEVSAAVERGLALLGGASRFVQPGESILLKPNLLVPRTANRAVTTHPAVFRAVAAQLQNAGAVLSYGDSPGFGTTEAAARRTGIAAAAQSLGIPVASFGEGETVSFPEGHLIRQFTIAQGVAQADGVVSLPKMKTHGLTRMTGAIKNQFGCIPGTLKAQFHARLPNADYFSRMLVDLNLLLRPRLFVMDGIVAMEGNGPQGGTPRPMEALLLSDDPVALDTAACRMMDLDPALVPPIVYGERHGLGLSGLEIVGDPLPDFVRKDFDVNRSPRSTTGAPGRPSRLARRFVVPKPVIREPKCTTCGTCVEVCPVSPKAVRFANGDRSVPPQHDYSLCIRCYCCQEMCPVSAIEIETPFLGRLVRH